MNYEWDQAKYDTNLKKHGVRFEDAVEVFGDLQALEVSIEENGEERFVRIGLNRYTGVLVVVYCERDENTVRIISARRATRNEERDYEKGI